MKTEKPNTKLGIGINPLKQAVISNMATYGLSKWSEKFPYLRLPPGTSFARSGSLEVRLAKSRSEIKSAQKLRYEVFYEELDAKPDLKTKARKRDKDRFDKYCDHLVVIDHDVDKKKITRKKPKIVGTYRLLRQEVAEIAGGFYSESEYDLKPLLNGHGANLNFLELGRSCVLEPYRTRPTIELLWQGIWQYINQHDIDVLFGCASFEGTDPEALKMPLSFLHHFAQASEEWQVNALDHLNVDMNLLPADDIDRKQAIRDLPALIRGYLRLGASIGKGAVVDHQFNTTDVMVILPFSHITDRYVTRLSSN